MALAAGLHDIRSAEPGGGVGDRADVMSSVTVVALGSFYITQLGDLAVVGLEVGLGDVLMATTALLHDVEAEIRDVGPLDAVRGVAVVAHRQGLVRLGYRCRMDTGVEGLVDPLVAAAAGRGHILGIHAGAWIATGQLIMRRMAIGTVRRHGQATLQQTLAVDALLVIFHHVGLRPFITERRLLPRAMALAAQGRNIA